MFFFIIYLMWYFDNFTTSAYLYLALHGSYGYFWLLKDFVFPDPNFARPVTLMSFLVACLIALIPYSFLPYWMISSRT